MQFLFGKPLADEILTKLQTEVSGLSIVPGLAVVVIGDDPASKMYVGLKERAATSIGMHFERHEFSTESVSQAVFDRIRALNADPAIHGVIVQLPLPAPFDESAMIGSIAPGKDADGFHPETLKHYFQGEIQCQPVFPRAVARLIRSAPVDLTGRSAVAIVNSPLFGTVMDQTLRLLGLESRVIARADFERQKDILHQAAVIVTACGEPGLLRGHMLSPGSVVIDGGITRRNDKVLGDVDLESVAELPGWIAPVPGGVGPLTVASLLERTVQLAGAQTTHGEGRSLTGPVV